MLSAGVMRDELGSVDFELTAASVEGIRIGGILSVYPGRFSGLESGRANFRLGFRLFDLINVVGGVSSLVSGLRRSHSPPVELGLQNLQCEGILFVEFRNHCCILSTLARTTKAISSF